MIPDSKRCIVSVGYHGRYKVGVNRQNEELNAVGYRGARLNWIECLPDGAPEHKGTPDAMPYAFKSHAVNAAARAGFTAILWLDSSVWPGLPVDSVFEKMERDGVYLVHETANMGHWTSDVALEAMGWTREQAFQQPMVLGGIWGVYLDHPVGAEYLERLTAMMEDPRIVQGHWRKAHGHVSDDERVQGHRHDMPAMSYLARDMGLHIKPPAEFLYGSDYPTPNNNRRQWHIRGV